MISLMPQTHLWVSIKLHYIKINFKQKNKLQIIIQCATTIFPRYLKFLFNIFSRIDFENLQKCKFLIQKSLDQAYLSKNQNFKNFHQSPICRTTCVLSIVDYWVVNFKLPIIGLKLKKSENYLFLQRLKIESSNPWFDK